MISRIPVYGMTIGKVGRGERSRRPSYFTSVTFPERVFVRTHVARIRSWLWG